MYWADTAGGSPDGRRRRGGSGQAKRLESSPVANLARLNIRVGKKLPSTIIYVAGCPASTLCDSCDKKAERVGPIVRIVQP